MNNLESITTNVYLNIILNWDTISSEQQIMDCLNNNTMCSYFKQQYPMLKDSFIKARVLTVLLMMYYILSLPVYDTFNESSNNTLLDLSEIKSNAPNNIMDTVD
jgi:hypothetical protein